MSLRIPSIVHEHVSIRMTYYVLRKHVDTVPQGDPPEIHMRLLLGLLFSIICKGHLAHIIETVQSMQRVQRYHKHRIPYPSPCWESVRRSVSLFRERSHPLE